MFCTWFVLQIGSRTISLMNMELFLLLDQSLKANRATSIYQ